jgi:hypothetical protein
MSLFKVALKRGASDPKTWKSKGDCRIVSRNSGFLSTDLVLIETAPATAQDIGQVTGVFRVEPVANDSFLGDDGWVLTIQNGAITGRSKHRS